jgi:hypothetical protein
MKIENVERLFAADIFEAERNAATATAGGLLRSDCDVIYDAIFDLQACGAAFGNTKQEIEAIVDRYVLWDSHGNPQPRSVDRSNVVILRKRERA